MRAYTKALLLLALPQGGGTVPRATRRRPVAIYHFQSKIISRGQGRGIVAAAAYRAGAALFDNEIGRMQNYLAKPGIVHSEIMLPAGGPDRWRDRETLWNEVMAGEVRNGAQRKSQLAREIEIALPRELSQAEAIRLVQDFVREQFVARGMVADLNVHWGVTADGAAQPHAHMLLTMRGVDPTGQRREKSHAGRTQRQGDSERGARGARDISGDPGADAGDGKRSDPSDHRNAGGDPAATANHPDQAGDHRAAARVAGLMAAARLRAGLRRHAESAAALSNDAGFGLKERAWNSRDLLRLWRERWAEMVNARLAELGHDVQVDHRSHAARGIVLEPQNKIGPAGARRAARQEDAERADEHRAIARRNGERLLAEPELALQALTHQQSTFTRQDLARLINRQTDGAAQFTAVMAKVEASPELVRIGKDGRGRDRFSTREMVGIEQRLMATAVALNKQTSHRVNDKRRIAAVNGQYRQLSEEQALAYLHVTRSRDLAVVVGIAGGGKSTLLGLARAVWEAEGYRVRGAALSGIAAEGLQGSAGAESRTIASWEYAWAQGKELLTPKDILVVDEAGMIGSRQLGRLIERVHAAGAKLVLVGDAEQLQAIEAGAAFRAIADQVGMMGISEPRRQGPDWQRLATKELATARTGAALGRYHDTGMVHQHATREATRTGVVAGWDAARRADPTQSQIILAHERADVRVLNEAARAMRRAAGELGPDHILQTELGPRAFAGGDRLYFLRNERGLGVKNGTLGTLTAIDGEQLTVRLDGPGGAGTGREVSVDLADYADLDHGYAATVHKSQGITVDQAHVLATPGMDRHLVYVAMSRHRHAAQLHWAADEFGDVEQLGARLGRERAKDTTLDYAEQPEPDPIAAYAGWRGLDPLQPVSEIVLVQPGPETERPIPESGRDRDKQRQSEVGPRPASLPARSPRRQGVAAASLAALARHREAQAGRDREMHQLSAPTSPSPADHHPRAQSSDRTPQASIPIEEWLAGLEASLAPQRTRDDRLEPMLPAVPYQPVTKAEVARLVAEHLATQPCPLQSRLESIYRNPVAARARLDALMQKSATVKDLIAQLEKKGAGVLGKLRGSTMLFAGADAYMERHLAKLDVPHLPSAIRAFCRLPAELEDRYRLKLEVQRGCEAVEVPGLSTKALAAITSLHRVGISTTVSVHNRPVEKLSSSEIRQAARVAPAWNAIPPWIRAELAAFRKAANARLGPYTDLASNKVLSRVYELSSNIAQAEQLADRHVAVEAARQHAEAQRRKAAQAAAEARQQAAEKAKLERKLRELQPRSRPRPSPGPSLG
jgi:Ti-type conjugative transfer relaxase TraA